MVHVRKKENSLNVYLQSSFYFFTNHLSLQKAVDLPVN